MDATRKYEIHQVAMRNLGEENHRFINNKSDTTEASTRIIHAATETAEELSIADSEEWTEVYDEARRFLTKQDAEANKFMSDHIIIGGIA